MLNVQEKHFAICNNSWVMYLLISMSLPLLGFQTHPITSFAIRRPRGDLACASTCVVLFSTSCIKESSKWPGTNRRSLILGWSDSTFEQLWSNRIHLKKITLGPPSQVGKKTSMTSVKQQTHRFVKRVSLKIIQPPETRSTWNLQCHPGGWPFHHDAKRLFCTALSRLASLDCHRLRVTVELWIYLQLCILFTFTYMNNNILICIYIYIYIHNYV
jgi:hypothetical protein